MFSATDKVHRARQIHRIAIVTLFHLAGNIRLVKEADALVEAGYEVDVFATSYFPEFKGGDASLLKEARWSAHFIAYDRDDHAALFWYSRVRRAVALRLWDLMGEQGSSRLHEFISLRALNRVTPEMQSAVSRHKADLYIGHGMQSLPIVVNAARKRGALAGFDAEDFHPGMRQPGRRATLDERITEFVEQRYIRQVDHLTAAAPGVAAAIVRTYPGVKPPLSILNVFPLSERPATPRRSSDSGPLRLYWFSQTIGRGRGLEDVVKACALLPPKTVELHLRGTWALGYEAEFTSNWAKTVGTRADLIVHGLLPPNEMVSDAASFDVGLALEVPDTENRRICMQDLSTNKVFTYLLAGLAIVASGLENNESIFDGAGFAYRSGDAAALAARLDGWARDRSRLNAAREQAWRLSAEKYNWDIEKHKFLRSIEQLGAA